MRLAPALIAALMFPAAALAHEIQAGDLEIIHPMIPLPHPGAVSAAAYLTVTNHGTEADRLLGAEMLIADRVTIHRSEISSEGVARMVPLEAIDLPGGDVVVLEPGGLHLMLLGLKGDFVEGGTVDATLIFERAGHVEVGFMVDPAEPADHGAGGHAGH